MKLLVIGAMGATGKEIVHQALAQGHEVTALVRHTAKASFATPVQNVVGNVLDPVTDGRLGDIVAEGFDAGIRLAEDVPQDLIAVPFGEDVRFLAVASPGYLARQSAPRTPHDMCRHRCIRHRVPSGRLYRWEFSKRGQEIAVDVPGALTLDDNQLMVLAAADGLGIAYVLEVFARSQLEAGTLVPVLADWCPPTPGLMLFYPGRRHVPSALRAFIDVLKEADRHPSQPAGQTLGSPSQSAGR